MVKNKVYNEEGIGLETSMEEAQNYHNEFIRNDALSTLHNYLKSLTATDVDFDKLSLAMAYLKYQHHPIFHVIADNFEAICW